MKIIASINGKRVVHKGKGKHIEKLWQIIKAIATSGKLVVDGVVVDRK